MFEEILNELPVGLFHARIRGGADDGLPYANLPLRRLLGFAESGRVPLEEAWSLVPQWERGGLEERLKDAARSNGTARWEGELSAPGGLRFIRLSANCRASEGGFDVFGVVEAIAEERRERDRERSLLKAVRELAERFESFKELYDGAASAAPERPGLDILSDRERAVAELILEGLTNKEIATKLYISESTVKKHTNSIFRKIEIQGRNDLFLLERF